MSNSELYLLLMKCVGFLIGWSAVFMLPWIYHFVDVCKGRVKHSEESEEE